MFEEIDRSIEAHDAWTNSFFANAATGQPWTRPQTNRFGWEYYWFTKAFPRVLTTLAARVEDDYLRGYLIEIVYSELGRNNRADMHSELFRRLLEGASIGGRLSAAGPVLPSTVALIDGLGRLYAQEPMAVSLGAQYALEYQADNMLRRFRMGFERMGVPEAELGFFGVHEEDEPAHIAAMRGALGYYLDSHPERPLALRGVSDCLALFGAFWAGLEGQL